MKIKAELYGGKIGVDGNLKDFIEKRECEVLLTLQNDDYRDRLQVILRKNDVFDLINQLNNAITHPEIINNNFTLV